MYHFLSTSVEDIFLELVYLHKQNATLLFTYIEVLYTYVQLFLICRQNRFQMFFASEYSPLHLHYK